MPETETETSEAGYIYILTNPSFEEYVKIGYADNVEERVRQLNRSEAVPFAFRIYATYPVSGRLLDKEVHRIFDLLNQDLRSRDIVDGKPREREFFRIDPEVAFEVLMSIARINNSGCLPEKREATPKEKADVLQAREDRQARAENFNFERYGIPVGAKLECPRAVPHDEIIVLDNRHVSYQGESYFLTGLMHVLLSEKNKGAGPTYFKYNGEWLNDIRQRIEQQGSELE